MSRAEALRVLTRQARANINDVFEPREHYVGMCPHGGGPIWSTEFGIRRLADLDPEKMEAISEICDSKDGVKIKFHNSRQAIESLSRMQGWDSKIESEVTHKIDEGTKELLKSEYENIRNKVLIDDDC